MIAFILEGQEVPFGSIIEVRYFRMGYCDKVPVQYKVVYDIDTHTLCFLQLDVVPRTKKTWDELALEQQDWTFIS